jgi:hypothetical protein
MHHHYSLDKHIIPPSLGLHIDYFLKLNIYHRHAALFAFVICFGPKRQLVSYVKGVVVRAVDVLAYGKQQVVIVSKVYYGAHRVAFAFINVGLA